MPYVWTHLWRFCRCARLTVSFPRTGTIDARNVTEVISHRGFGRRPGSRRSLACVVAARATSLGGLGALAIEHAGGRTGSPPRAFAVVNQSRFLHMRAAQPNPASGGIRQATNCGSD